MCRTCSATSSLTGRAPLRTLVLYDGPYLHAPMARPRTTRGHLDRVVQVLGFDQTVPAELLLGLDERSVSGRDLAVTQPQGGGGGGGLVGGAGELVRARRDVRSQRQ